MEFYSNYRDNLKFLRHSGHLMPLLSQSFCLENLGKCFYLSRFGTKAISSSQAPYPDQMSIVTPSCSIKHLSLYNPDDVLICLFP